MNYRILLYCALLEILLSTSCSSTNTSNESAQEKLLKKVISSTTQNIQQYFPVNYIGMGGGETDGRLNFLSLSFQILDPLVQEKARELIFFSTDMLLQTINNEEIYKNYFVESPFPLENIEIVIYSCNKDGSEAIDPFFSTSSLTNGKITYRSIAANNTHTYQTTLTESYISASLLQSAKCGLQASLKASHQ